MSADAEKAFELQRLSQLMMLASQRGDLDAELDLSGRVVDVASDVRPELVPHYLRRQAEIHAQLNRPADQARTYERLLEVEQRFAGPGAPARADLLLQLGGLYLRLGRADDAEARIGDAIVGLGRPVEMYLVALECLANVCDLKGEHEREVDIRERVLAARQALFDGTGDQNTYLALAKSNLGEAYRKVERLSEAEQLFREALQLLGASADHALPTLNGLPLVKSAQGDLQTASAIFGQAA